MTNDELKQLEQQRARAHELAYSDTTGRREAYAEVVKQLDAEIATGRAELRQQAAEDEVRRKLRIGFAGTDEAFAAVWEKNKDALMLDALKSAAAKAEAESREMLRRAISG